MSAQLRAAGAVLLSDPRRFARENKSLAGESAVSSLERLAGQLFDANGVLDYRFTGTLDRRQRPTLHCIINGQLNLICQRCLGALQHPVNIDSHLVLVADEAALPPASEEGDEEDYIVASHNLDLHQLIEDEVLLSLPIAPTHEACAQLTAPADSDAASQFSALRKLKQNRP